MLAYHYDENGYFDGKIECQKDDLESIKQAKTIYLQPANSTNLQPPESKDGFKIRWSGEDWTYEEIEQDTVPPEPTAEDLKKARIAELQNFLTATDWYSVRFAETGVAVPEDVKAKRQAAREEISRLRDEALASGD